MVRSIWVSFDPGWKVNEESDRHELKHLSPRIATEEGMQIDVKDEHSKNAFRSIRISLESDSNVNEEIEEQ
jgi:hypothetical protein